VTEYQADRPAVVYDRGRFERVLRAVREILTIVVLLLVLVFMAGSFAVAKTVVDRLGTPDPAVPTFEPAPGDTSCPFGEGQCGD
jgi:hypothetical protein